jgi:PAS domain S-box-containing protein
MTPSSELALHSGDQEEPLGDGRRIALAAFAAAVPLSAITIWLALQTGGAHASEVVRDLGQAAAACVAGLSCAWMARRSSGRARWAWALLGVSAASALAGEFGEAFYTVVLNRDTPSPSLADLGILGAIPFAVAGLESFPKATGKYTSRNRAVLDAAMVGLSMLFVSWAMGLDQIYRLAHTPLAQLTAIAYPVGDIVMVTALFITLRGSLPSQRGRLVVIISGLAVNAFSDSATAFLAASDTGSTLQPWFAAGSMYGYTLVALAPLYPENRKAREESELAVWRMLLPYVGVVAVVVTALYRVITKQYISPYVAFPAAGLLIVLIASQLQTYMDWLGQLRRSREAEALVRERETMLDNLISHAPQGVARVTRDRKMTDANPRLAAILQAPASKVVGARLDNFLPPEEVQLAFSGLGRVTNRSQDTFEAETAAKRSDGSEAWLQWSVTPIRKPDGSIDYYMAMFEDVTAKHEADELAAANLAQLEKLNRLKSEFVSMVSHEFRTALVGIQGFSELIRDDDLEMSEVKNLAGDINNDAERLGRMINEMLDLDRLEAGKIRLDLKPIDLNELLREAADRARVSTSKHVVTTDLQPHIPDVLVDMDRLTQVLTNLLSNAIKYSPDGGEISIRSRLEGTVVEVAIKDHGLGIPHEFISRLFGRYERYEDKHAGKIIGTGLGLAISRQIVEMHGGKISVDSVVGSGSEFRFTVPVATKVAPRSFGKGHW